jgi:hypothetical protein
MAKNINSIQGLKDYFSKVLLRANHHAHGVNEIALAIMGGIIWKAKDFKVMEMNGDTKNVLWMDTGNGQFYFTYDHATSEIVIRKDNSQGAQLARFNNHSTNTDVKTFFESI